jgi:hypothetical protein
LNLKQIVVRFRICLDSDGNWIHSRFGETAIRIFLKQQFPEVIPTVILISTLLKNQPVAERFWPERFLDALAFYDCHARANLTNLPSDGLEIRSFTFLQNYAEVDCRSEMESTRRFAESLKEFSRATDTFISESHDLVPEVQQVSENLVHNFSDKLEGEFSSAKKLWDRFFHWATMERAPWNLSLPTGMRQSHFKRDFTICQNLFCPKLKRNFRFNDHWGQEVAATPTRLRGSKSTFVRGTRARIFRIYPCMN